MGMLGAAGGIGTIFGPLGILFTLTFMSTCGLMMFANVFGLYALEKFSYGPEAVGIIMMVLGLATALQIPALSSLTSRRAEVEQGIAMGLSNSFVSLGRIVGPVLAGVLFDWNIELPYVAGAGVMILAAILALFTLKSTPAVTQTA